MRILMIAGVVIANLFLVAAAPPPASIGAATMTPDGTISLRLQAQGLSGLFGDSVIIYRRSDPRYEQVLHHLDGLKPGQTKPVPPWKN
jgi:hypothetical protein